MRVPAELIARGTSAPVGRGVRGFTMMELLVTLGILAIALASVLSIFARGSRFGLRAQERTEAGRVAQAVFDLVDRGFKVGAARRGRQDDGSLLDETISSQELDPDEPTPAQELDGKLFPSLWKPAYVTTSHAITAKGTGQVTLTRLRLVWGCEISDHKPPGHPDGLHMLEITVRFDDNGNGMFNTEDRDVGKYYAILADREVPP